MKKWWFIIKSLGTIFRVDTAGDIEDEVDLYVCAICGSIYMDKRSYITHYRVDSCTIERDPLPLEPLELRPH